jgi:hypothetical protein
VTRRQNGAHATDFRCSRCWTIVLRGGRDVHRGGTAKYYLGRLKENGPPAVRVAEFGLSSFAFAGNFHGSLAEAPTSGPD